MSVYYSPDMNVPAKPSETSSCKTHCPCLTINTDTVPKLHTKKLSIVLLSLQKYLFRSYKKINKNAVQIVSQRE